MNIPRDKFMLCLGGFILVALGLAGWGVVLASQLESRALIFHAPQPR